MEQEQQQPPPQIIEASEKADLLDKINPDAIVEIIRNKLMGKEFIDGKWVTINALQPRALTQLGAWDISNLMLAVSSKNVSISNLKDSEIKKRVLLLFLLKRKKK